MLEKIITELIWNGPAYLWGMFCVLLIIKLISLLDSDDDGFSDHV